jgi:hypothetical protein
MVLPKYTDLFSDTLSISSINVSSGVATIITSVAHNLDTGDEVTLSEVKSQTPLNTVSQDGLIFTFTSDEHDLTYGWPEHETVELSGFTDSSWNGSFTLMDVPNRKTFKVQSTNTLPTLTGAERLLEVTNTGINGIYSVTVVNSTTFTISGISDDGEYTGGKVYGNVRIAGAVDFNRAMEQYTENNFTDLWGFVVMHDADTSRDRNTFSDATATPVAGSTLRLRMVDGFSVYIFVNVSADIAAMEAIDICRDTLLAPILKTLFGVRFDSGVTGSDFSNIITGHGVALYNRAIYVHVYNFETSMDITQEDAVIPSDTRAFRDIDYTQTVDTQDMTVDIDLDDDPIEVSP